MHIVAQAKSGGSGGFQKQIEELMKKVEDFVFKMTSRPKSKPRFSGMDGQGGGLEAYQQGGGGGKPPGDQPGWGGGGGDADDRDEQYSLGDLRKFLKEWGEYGFTILAFFVAYQMLWPLAAWCEKVQESPRSIFSDFQDWANNLKEAVKWLIGWGDKPGDYVIVDDEGREWVEGPLCLAVNMPLDPNVEGYEVEAPTAFDTLRYPNMSQAEKFALTNYNAVRPWERVDNWEVSKEWVDAIYAKYAPEEADLKLYQALKREGRESDYWAMRRVKRMDPDTGVFATVSEDYDPDMSELDRLESIANREAIKAGVSPISEYSEPDRWGPEQMREFEKVVGEPFAKRK